ncbi:MAG: hypothetical protein V8R50_04895 [Clostridia bacterium]
MKNLLIKNAKLRYTNELTDILICDGIFQKIGEITDPPADTEIIDATGNLVTPPIIDPHVHLDAVLVAGILPRKIRQAPFWNPSISGATGNRG